MHNLICIVSCSSCNNWRQKNSTTTYMIHIPCMFARVRSSCSDVILCRGWNCCRNTHTHTQTDTDRHKQTHTHTHVHMYTCTYVHKYTRTNTHISHVPLDQKAIKTGTYLPLRPIITGHVLLNRIRAIKFLGRAHLFFN
jgi:hypothetical protein